MPSKAAISKQEKEKKPDLQVGEPAAPKDLEFLGIKKLDDHIRLNLQEAFVEHIAKALHARIPLFEGSKDFRSITLEVILDCLHIAAPRWRPLTNNNFTAVSRYYSSLFFNMQDFIDGLKADY